MNSPEVSLVLLCPYLTKSAPYGSSQQFFGFFFQRQRKRISRLVELNA